MVAASPARADIDQRHGAALRLREHDRQPLSEPATGAGDQRARPLFIHGSSSRLPEGTVTILVNPVVLDTERAATSHALFA